jgi:hypothetical protein
MPEVKYIPHEGQSVLLLDFSDIADYSVLPGLVDEGIRLAQAGNARHSVRALIDLSGTRVRKPVIDSLERLSKNNGPYMKAVAFVGLSGSWSLLLSMFLRSAGRSNHHVLHNRDQALRWLALQ